ncbi:MAG: Hpt domain-containing protein [Thiobacillus sp.]
MSALLDYDTGPLNWVRSDIDTALQAALGRVQAYAVDADLTNALRLARDDAHQVAGALRMVGLEGAATLATTLEASLAAIHEQPALTNDSILRAISNTLEGLQRWVKERADGRGSGELALFPLYKSLRELQGAERVFEGELFFPDLRACAHHQAANDSLSPEAVTAQVKSARAHFQRGLLAFLRGVEAEAGLRQMRSAITSIESIAPSSASQTFWWACAGFIDSLIAHGVEADFHVKQLLARVDLQMRRLMEGSPQVAERLMRDALFFVAKSQAMEGCAAEVRASFGLDRYLPGKGLLDPETLARMRPVLGTLTEGLKAAREAWRLHVEGQSDQLDAFQTQIGRLQTSSNLIENSGLGDLLTALSNAANATVSQTGEPRDALNLEIASTLLFMQSAVEQEAVLHSDFAERAAAQQARLVALAEGRSLPAALIETQSQRDAERDMLHHLAIEVASNLKKMEDTLDAFFRDATERVGLADLSGLSQQAQGALTMLELNDASLLLGASMDALTPYLEIGVPDQATQARVADAFSSLGLYIESHCAGRNDANRILKPVLIEFGLANVGDDDTMVEETVESGLPRRKQSVQAAYLDWRVEPDDTHKKKLLDSLTELGNDADLIADSALKQQAKTLLEVIRPASHATLEWDDAIVSLSGLDLPARTPDREQAIEAIPANPAVLELAQPEVTPCDEAAVPQADTALELAVAPAADADMLAVRVPDETDPELLDIFLEEAVEVLATLHDATETCRTSPDDQDALVVIRRAFHTLKGSGRMVSLNELGDVAWSMEQLMNGWRADQRPANDDLLSVIGESHDLFTRWVEALRQNVGLDLPVPALLTRVNQLANGQPLSAPLQAADTIALSEDTLATSAAESVELAIEVPATVHTALIEAAVAPAQPQPVYRALIEIAQPVYGARIEVARPVYGALVEIAQPVYGALIEHATPAMPGDYAQQADTPLDELCIGDVHVSTGLYDVFVAEARQHINALREESVLQSSSSEVPVSEAARRAAHTLGGIAGTAGFVPLLDLAHALELNWGRCPDRALSPGQLALTQASIRRLEAQVAAIESHNPPPMAEDLITLLGEPEGCHQVTAAEYASPEPAQETTSPEMDDTQIHDTPTAPDLLTKPLSSLSGSLKQYWTRFASRTLPVAAPAGVTAYHADNTIECVAPIEDDGLEAPIPTSAESACGVMEAPIDIAADVIPDSAIEIAPQDTVTAGGLDLAGLVPDPQVAAPTPVFERREVQDEIDTDLLPIFLDEAETLLPESSAALRAWKATPQDNATRDLLSRGLHTLKGSSRMVGAMRLGELTHVMESRVIAVAEGQINADSSVFDTLESQFDRLIDAIDRLKQGELSPADTEAVQPLEALVQPVMSPAEHTADVIRSVTKSQPVARDNNALTLRVRADWVDRMVNQAGEVAIARSRIESEVFAFKRHVGDLTEALHRLRGHIREVEIQAESQMQATFQTQGGTEQFDPLEFDRFTRFQEVTRFLAESVNDIATVQHILQARLGETDAALIQQTRLNRELQQNLLRVRMVPLYSISERLYRTVRQTTRDVNKRAQLDIQGGELEIDRSVLEKVTAPLEHLLRNALAHGIETPDARRNAGKAEFGEIILSARQSGNEMLLTVKDDGAGLNYTRIREKAEAQGLLAAGQETSDAQLAQMIFAAGFSTADVVSEVSGRGVGMDVVKSEISSLGGRIDIQSEAGKGTCFMIYLPLTLAMTQAVMVNAAKNDYALPAPLVRQVIELKPDALAAAQAAGEINWRGARYSLSYLPHLLGDTSAVHEVQRYNSVLLLASGSNQAAILVDTIEGTREIVVKNIGPQMARITGVAGATVRGDGRVILILNPLPLALRWDSQSRDQRDIRTPSQTPEVSTVLQPPLVLVVDDSLTVRKITTRLLGREGYRFDSAKDGVDALERMQEIVPDVVLLDVEMPRMDGFELARVMRNDARLKQVPIIMITSRTADKHRNHALEIGVNIYLGKPYQEQLLLEHIAEQVGLAVSV